MIEQKQAFGRAMPFATLVASSLLLVAHHLYVRSHGKYLPLAMFVVPMLWMIALGGTIYPPVFYSISKHGHHPLGVKVMTAVLALVGFGCAFYFATILY